MTEFLSAETHTSVFSRETIFRTYEKDLGNTVFILISLKTEIARSVKGPKITRAPCRRRIGGAVPRAEKFLVTC